MKSVFAGIAGLVAGLGLGFVGSMLTLEPAPGLGSHVAPLVSVSPQELLDAEERIAELEAQLAQSRAALEDTLRQAEADAQRRPIAGDEVPEVVETPEAEAEEHGDGRGGRGGGGDSVVPIVEGTKRDRWGLPVDENLTDEQILLLMNSENPRDVLRGLRSLEQLPDRGQAIELARQRLDGGQPWMRLQAMESLVKLEGAAASTSIAPLLLDDVEWVGRSAARKLGEIGDPAGIAPLQQSFREGEGRLRFESALALRSLGDNSAVGVIAQTATAELSSADGNLRADAVRTLGSLGDISYNVQLVTALADTNSGVRRNAARALARQGTSSELSALQMLLNDPVDDVRRNAERAIRYIQNPEERNNDEDGRWR